MFFFCLQQLLGIGDTVAEDADWVGITYYSRKKNKHLNRGRVAISIAIVPESEAKSRPVGSGRDEPNQNPYLFPPVGRMSL
jgi:hypothetical protein